MYIVCKKILLQGLVVGGWVPCDHILLINLCSETLRLGASVSELWGGRRQFGPQKAEKEKIEILKLKTILFTYRRCLIWPPPTSIHFVYRLIMSCRHIIDASSCFLYSCHKILLCFHWSLVHKVFHVPPEIEIQ